MAQTIDPTTPQLPASVAHRLRMVITILAADMGNPDVPPHARVLMASHLAELRGILEDYGQEADGS